MKGEGCSMLIQFRFQNFKSFRDDTVLDLSATKITEHADRVVVLGTERVLPTAAIYGANGSGKSNALAAFRFMAAYVTASFGDGSEPDHNRPTRTPFLFDTASKDAVSSFEVYFIISEEDGCRSYNYGFTLNQNGVAEEWLNERAKTARKYRSVFYRSADDLDLSGLPGNMRDGIKASLSSEALIVSLGAKQQNSKLKAIQDWFQCVSFAVPDNPFGSAIPFSWVPEGFASDAAVRQQVADYLAVFDPTIIGLQVSALESSEKNEELLKIDAVHRMADSDAAVSIPLEHESSGTRKMMALYPILQGTLHTGGVLLLDDLDIHLHPLLVRDLLILFLDPETNPRHAQLIFTTHDVWQLSNGLLRRDEIWFATKALSGVSALYSLADFLDEDGVKIRKDESYAKNYLLGKYGAVPVLKAFDLHV